MNDKLGSGSFGSVVGGLDTVSGVPVAFKLCRVGKTSSVDREAAAYGALSDSVVMPKLLYRGNDSDNKHHALVMEKMGPNLEDVFLLVNQYRTVNRRRFSLTTLSLISIRLLQLLKQMSSTGYIHCDVKPQNFVFTVDPRENMLAVVDFGLTRSFLKEDGTHVDMEVVRQGKHPRLLGTPRYCSLNSHMGRTLSRRDDLESVCYVIRFLAFGTLPWWDVEATSRRAGQEAIRRKKRAVKPRRLFEGYPVEFQELLEHARGLEFEECPDYDRFIRKFEKLLEAKGTDVVDASDLSSIRCDWWSI